MNPQADAWAMVCRLLRRLEGMSSVSAIESLAVTSCDRAIIRLDASGTKWRIAYGGPTLVLIGMYAFPVLGGWLALMGSAVLVRFGTTLRVSRGSGACHANGWPAGERSSVPRVRNHRVIEYLDM